MSTDHSTSGALREARGVMFGEDQSDDPKFDKIIDVLNSVNSRLQHIESQVSKIDDIQKCLSFLTIKVNSLESDMNDMKASNVDLERNTQAISDLYDDLKSKSDRNKEEIIQLKRQGIGATNINYIKQLHDLAELQKDRDELKAAVTDLQCRSMKNNLIFLGLKENNSENTEQLLRDFLYHELEIDQRIEFGNVHRFGRRNAGKSRPIVARFLYHMDLVMVKENTYKLRGTPFSVNEQFPAVIEDQRKKLYPVMKHHRQAGHRVKLVRDKLFIDGQLYDPINGQMQPSWRKLLQKQAYDIISHRYGLLTIVIGVILITVSAFHFGETVFDWSKEKYASVFNSFSDNIAGRSFRERLCLPVPIDVVYTWVNGTDPALISQLRQVRLDMEEELNLSRNPKCVFANCLPTNMIVLDPVLPEEMSLAELIELSPVYRFGKQMFMVNSPSDGRHNFTVVIFGNDTQVHAALKEKLVVNGVNVTAKRAFITTDWTIQHSILLHDTVIMTGFSHKLTSEELREKFPEKHRKAIEKIEIHEEKGAAVLYIPNREELETILNESNFTIDGKEPTLSSANLIWDLRDFSRDEDVSASRFQDNEELRYSLRSVEMFAPWVRNIYIVTNGQIPYWLNLEHPRLKIITHDEIFDNKSHLPTFGSPAIEANIHKIPGLSDKFIYMNDDVLFGVEVWPDDFFSYSTGQKMAGWLAGWLGWLVAGLAGAAGWLGWLADGWGLLAGGLAGCAGAGGLAAGLLAGLAGWLVLAGLGRWRGVVWLLAWAGCLAGCAGWLAGLAWMLWLAALVAGWLAGCLHMKYDVELGYMYYDLDLGQMYFIISPHQKHLPIHFFPYGNLTTHFSTTGSHRLAKISSITRREAQMKTSVPHTFLTDVGQESNIGFALNWSHIPLPAMFRFQAENLQKQLENGEITDKGFNLRSGQLWGKIVKFLELKPETEQSHVIEILKQRQPEITADRILKLQRGKQRLKRLAANEPFKLDRMELKRNGSDVIPLNPVAAQGPAVPQRKNITQQNQNMLREHVRGANTSREAHLPLDIQNVVFEREMGKPEQTAQGVVNVDQAERVEVAHQQPPASVNKMAQGDDQGAAGPQGGKLKNLFFGKSEQEKSDAFKVPQGPARQILEAKVEEDEDIPDLKELHHEIIQMNIPITPDVDAGLFPWEKSGVLVDLQKKKEKLSQIQEYQLPSHAGRRLLDTFGDSLRHVNKLYNKEFGYEARKVPAHMPHMIDKNIMAELQARFPKQWEDTSAHRVRHSLDMQYAFSYFYYLMGVKVEVSPHDVFETMDTDKSRVLSDRELRTMATRLYDLPLDLPTITGLENIFVNCSEHLPPEKQVEYPPTQVESYYEKSMPQITRSLFLNCPAMTELVKRNFKPKAKYRFTTLDDSDITFKMIKTNISTVVGQLDDIRKHTKKFICLNDNIDHNDNQAKTVKAILQDFYESVFPLQSQFELPMEYRNRFLHMNELREWRHYRDWLKFWTHLALCVLVVLTLASYFAEKIEAAQRRLMRRKKQSEDNTDDNDSNREKEKSKKFAPVEAV
ncbi:hypothetical protein ScPMuIL_015879 [Solemya velum]